MKALLPRLCIVHLCLTPSPVEGHTRRGFPIGANLSPRGPEVRPPVPLVGSNRVLRIRSVQTQPICCRRESECPPVFTCGDSTTSERKSKRGRHPHRGSLHFVQGISYGVSPRLEELNVADAWGRKKKKKSSSIYPTGEDKQLSLRLSPQHVRDSLMVCKNESIFTTVTVSWGAEEAGDLLEELYRGSEVRRSSFPKYAFFKNADDFLGLEKIYTISTRRRWKTTSPWSSLMREDQLNKCIRQIDDMKGVYSEDLLAGLYALKHREEKRYLDQYTPSHYANSFIFLFPPPNLSGELHAGHYFNFVQLHVLLLFSRHIWSKFSLALYGADHGGLSAHAAFSRVANPKWTREKYMTEMKQWQEKLKEKILMCMQKMNIVVDRSRFYSTMDENMKNIVMDTFRVLYRNDFIVKKLYPVYYCPRLGTIVSKLDVEFREALRPKWRVTLRLVDGGEELHAHTSSDSPNGDTYPTEKSEDRVEGELPSCKYTNNSEQKNEVKFFPQSFHHFFNVKSIHEMEPGRTPSEYIHIEVANLEELKGIVAILYFSSKKEKRYRGKYALLPLLNRGIPLICGNERNVLPVLRRRKVEEITLHGVGHGENAEDVFIPVFSKERDFNHYANGTGYTQQSEELRCARRGDHTVHKEAQSCRGEQGLLPLVEHLMKNGLAEVVTPLDTKLKCAFYKNNECVLTLAEQWCLHYEKLCKTFFDGPHGGEKRSYRIIPSKYGDYFTGAFIPPTEWTLSRQVPYGHPVPLFKYEPPEWRVKKGDHLENTYCYVYGKDVDEAYHSLSKSQLLEDSQIRREFLKREDDVLDNWFSSSLYPLHCIKELGVDLPEFLRLRGNLVDFLLTGKDILQPWVVRSFVVLNYMLKHWGEDGKPVKKHPVEDADMKTDYTPPPLAATVKFHGILKDQTGRKISKSEMNASYYDNLVREANVDEVRLSFCFIQRDTEDVHLSENINRKSRKFLAKLWNVAKYIEQKCPLRSYEQMNRWSASTASNTNLAILTHLERTPHARISHVGTFRRYLQMVNSVLCEMKDYNVGKAINVIFNFLVNIFSKFYLTLHSGGYFKDGEDKLISNFLPVYIFRGILKIVFPFVPHISEVLYIRFFHREQMDSVGERQKPFHVSTPLSSNYNLMKNEMLAQIGEMPTPLDESFDVFTQLYTLLAKYRREKYLLQGHTFHVYLKQNYQDEVPIEYFKNEEASLEKFLGVNVRFTRDRKFPLEGNSSAYRNSTWEIIHDDSSFTITVGRGATEVPTGSSS
ncbi:valine--tRNA ligase, putative [Plasmodium knowlesi strain H]|uniref:valine--tRNA ligase n=3 Tax=Plasmodium knowlesi TaxID=5850 RepID=A0A5K1TXI1_PLAKH|nr:valine--tRNA ligase, putative [Plasmodium knowlesi strain H]OTN65751.1 putative ValS protein [Plasmodium knowlesi]CAA9987956.1 valine--tRNA ligase, putative [Plasmodium knowlesi strain H]SBO22162.1 valine--tRNA ligase, putative [Plasmodium knowlesi strain H]SBO29186.1 valine--tRNA ligase, putative [Plasmodium knowlesi strain H]VVS77430.1 valine--tRNA ligase, putative [Plasmodium knowlesi strain H]|eukprot:XP_002258935.1 ValS protein, putative [Plasmodium knowlesi strain H]